MFGVKGLTGLLQHCGIWQNLRSFSQKLFWQEILPDECGKQEDEAVKIGPFTDMCLLGGGAAVTMLPLV